jgi:hypothetical protein
MKTAAQHNFEQVGYSEFHPLNNQPPKTMKTIGLNIITDEILTDIQTAMTGVEEKYGIKITSVRIWNPTAGGVKFSHAITRIKGAEFYLKSGDKILAEIK